MDNTNTKHQDLLQYYNNFKTNETKKTISIKKKSAKNDSNLKKKFNIKTKNIKTERFESLYKGDTYFDERSLDLSGYNYNYLLAGNFKSEDKIVFLGGFPLDEKETMKWLVSHINQVDRLKYRFYILSFPFFDNNTKLFFSYPPLYDFKYSIQNSQILGTNTEIDLSSIPVDPRFDLKNQSRIIYTVLENLNIDNAHFIGHGIGCTVLDYLLSEFPKLARSYCRSSQLWDNYNKSWEKLAMKVVVGPPIKYLNIPDQLSKIWTIESQCSPNFSQEVQDNKNPSSIYNRFEFIRTDLSINLSNTIFKKKVSQIFMQLDLNQEVSYRKKKLSKTNIPIMQFEGEDQFTFITNQHGYLPYFGMYNLFKDEIENLTKSDVIFRNIDTEFSNNLITKLKYYKIIKSKPKARINKFVIIPKSCYFTIIENPQGCAQAINDFIKNY